jgi:hypothetical protein
MPLDRGLCFATKFNHIWFNNVLVIKKGLYQTNELYASIAVELKPPSPITLPYMINTIRGIQTSKPRKKMKDIVSIK